MKAVGQLPRGRRQCLSSQGAGGLEGLHHALDIGAVDLRMALAALCGDDTLDMATDLIDGEVRFFGLQSPGLQLDGCELHQRLLREYAKAHAA